MKQFTIKSPISLEGIGVHSGKSCKITIEPAPCNSGIVYIRAPYDSCQSIVAADYKNVSDTTMCTRITNEFGVTVSVVEHISAAFYGLGVTNAVVKLEEGDEIPFLDGSSLRFVEAIEAAGLQEQSEERRKIRILREVKIGDVKKWASLSPFKYFVAQVNCDFSARGLKTEPFIYNSDRDNFKKDVAGARTFGFFSDVEYLRKNNLAIGASLENTVVFGNDGHVMNPEGLRYHDEPVRHKLLDAVGDLSLSQYEILGKYDAFCPGHNINNLLLRELFKDEKSYILE